MKFFQVPLIGIKIVEVVGLLREVLREFPRSNKGNIVETSAGPRRKSRGSSRDGNYLGMFFFPWDTAVSHGMPWDPAGSRGISGVNPAVCRGMPRAPVGFTVGAVRAPMGHQELGKPFDPWQNVATL